MMRFATAAVLLLVFSVANALVIPQPGSEDFRVRTADYHEGQVYKITGFFGFNATVILNQDEKVIKVGGFDAGWKVDDLGNKIMIQPRLEKADSNLTVVTTRRVYFFDLTVRPFPKGKFYSQANDHDQMYGLRFRYPDDEATLEAAKARLAAAQKALAAVRAKAEIQERELEAATNAPSKKTKHWDYSYMGSEAIKPYEVYDDGTFTHFKFYAQQNLPAFFVLNDDGTESMVNKFVVGDEVVVQRVAKQFELRMGGSVTCIYNDNPPILTPSTGTQTENDQVQRVLKGDER